MRILLSILEMVKEQEKWLQALTDEETSYNKIKKKHLYSPASANIGCGKEYL
jgi:hypothetical protein